MSPSGDLVKVDGIENLKQAVILRLMVYKGESERDPTAGSYLFTLIGQRYSAIVDRLVRNFVYEALIGEPRFRDVIDIKTDLDPSQRSKLRISGRILTVNKFVRITDEPHKFDSGLDDHPNYRLKHSYVREVIQISGIINDNVILFTADKDYSQMGDTVYWIAEGRNPSERGTFLVTYTVYDVTQKEGDNVPFNVNFELGE